jgi:hypothetical protein
MTRRAPTAILLAVIALLAVAAAEAGAFTKAYVFKPGVNLEVGEEIGAGLRLDSIRFDVPGEQRGAFQASATISNLGDESHMFSVGIALFDDAGNLLAAGNGGPRMFPLRKGRQGPFKVSFDGFDADAANATQFKIVIAVSR